VNWSFEILRAVDKYHEVWVEKVLLLAWDYYIEGYEPTFVVGKECFELQ